MKVKILFSVISVIITLLFLESCAGWFSTTATPYQFLQERGNVLGEHFLVETERFIGVDGKAKSESDWFSPITGSSVSSSSTTENKLQIYWEYKPGVIIASTLPFSKFEFIIDSTKIVPTIEFVFENWWLNNTTYGYHSLSESSHPNVNDIIMSSDYVLAMVKVRITEYDLENEVYLSKQN